MPLPRFARAIWLLALIASAAASPAAAVEPTSDRSGAKRHYLYLLRLVPRLQSESGWTKADEETVGRHFQYLKAAVARGQVVLAGKTDEPGDRTFGLVVFEAADEKAARKFMEADPAVAAGLMTAELRPYHLALLRQG